MLLAALAVSLSLVAPPNAVANAMRGWLKARFFNHWRAPHVGGDQWAASESLYPYPHG